MSRTYRLLIPIVLIVLVAVYIDLPNSPGIHFIGINRDFSTHLGLDLVGGVQALLEADVPATTAIDPTDMSVAENDCGKSCQRFGCLRTSRTTSRIAPYFSGASWGNRSRKSFSYN